MHRQYSLMPSPPPDMHHQYFLCVSPSQSWQCFNSTPLTQVQNHAQNRMQAMRHQYSLMPFPLLDMHHRSQKCMAIVMLTMI
eukprot:12425527-Karenia_brevis.AAC.1